MTKLKFLLTLHEKLSGLPQDEVEEHLNFYSEMIEDRMEEGLSEEEAVAAVGSVDEIASQIAAEIPLAKIAKEKIMPKRQLKAWEITLLALGSPIWFSLLIAAFAVTLSIYAALWSVVVSLWAVFVSMIASAFGVILAGIGLALVGKGLTGFALLGGGIVCTGLSIFLFFGCKAVTKGVLVLTKSAGVWIKRRFIKKEAA